MKLSTWVRKIHYWWQFQPFTRPFALLVLIYFFISYFTAKQKVDTSSFIGLILLMAKIIFVLTLVIVILCLLTALIAYLWFLYKKGKHTKAISVNMDLDKDNTNDLLLRTDLPFALRPFLGYVKVKLMYDGLYMTEAYEIQKRTKGHWFFFQQGLTSTNHLQLPDIKEYNFQKALVYFHDFLNLFSFAAVASVNQSIRNTPKSLLQGIPQSSPKKTEEEKVRIEQLRKVQGEFLNYKKFEDSDDVRRIVWKIFAKNKELVVRIPEIMDPFSSHVYMYASFFNPVRNVATEDYHTALLNYFKQWTYTIYNELTKQEFNVKYIPDQLVSATENNVRDEITLSTWHSDASLVSYFKPQYASILCIHSFTPLNEVEQIISSVDKQTTIFLIQLSKALSSHYIWSWLGYIFLLPKKDALAKLKSKWPLHPLKYTTVQAEKKLIHYLRQQDCNFELLP